MMSDFVTGDQVGFGTAVVRQMDGWMGYPKNILKNIVKFTWVSQRTISTC